MEDISSKEDIKLLVDTFYQKVAKDPVIGHHFSEVAKVNWDHHLPKMYEFWSLLLLGKGDYKGNTTETHVQLSQKRALTKDHFDHWITLFSHTVDELFEGEKAALAKEKANYLGMIMQVKL